MSSIFKSKEDDILLMTEFIEIHQEFATGRLSALNVRNTFRKSWQELANHLNVLAIRTMEKWQKVVSYKHFDSYNFNHITSTHSTLYSLSKFFLIDRYF